MNIYYYITELKKNDISFVCFNSIHLFIFLWISFLIKPPLCASNVLIYLKNITWKHSKPAYHLMTGDIYRPSMRFNIFSEYGWPIINLNLNKIKFDDFRYILVKSNKNSNWTNHSQKQYIVRLVNKYPFSLFSAKICWKWNIFIHTFVTVFICSRMFGAIRNL